MSLESSQISELKETLLGEKARLEGELARFAKPTGVPGQFETQMENLGDDSDESASEVEGYVDNLALETTLETQLKDATDALQRIEDGTFGVDEVTGEEISLERLKAYPAARTAI
ncbi:MAG: TraR/DksA C4-type zinc finger protein [Patescibacteria group bacterium]